jgi:hypothetical protein
VWKCLQSGYIVNKCDQRNWQYVSNQVSVFDYKVLAMGGSCNGSTFGNIEQQQMVESLTKSWSSSLKLAA